MSEPNLLFYGLLERHRAIRRMADRRAQVRWTDSGVKTTVVIVPSGPPGNTPDWRSAAREIERAFPKVVSCWYGETTGTWWAMAAEPDGLRLLEAVNLLELRQAISNARGWPWPR